MLFEPMDDALDRIADRLRAAERVLFITGAGISADSGLPTYRGVGGLYEDRLASEDLPIEAILSGEMLQRRPELTWKHVLEIERACRGAASRCCPAEKRSRRRWGLAQGRQEDRAQSGRFESQGQEEKYEQETV